MFWIGYAPGLIVSDIPELSVGVDVGGTKIAAAAVSGTTVIESHERPTVLDPSEILDEIECAAREVITASPGPVAAVGIGVPSQVHFATGRVMASVNIPLAGVELRQVLEQRLGLPVYVDNDGNCAALAEAYLAEGAAARHLVMYTMGTGVGGGVVIDGRVFRGATGLGAELGHVVVQSDGPECPGNCPNRGCLEAVASGTALGREATRLAREQPDSGLGRALASGRAITGPLVTELAHDGDEAAIEAIALIGRNLGVGIANYANIFNPEVVVIGGGVIGAGELLLAPARDEMLRRALRPSRDEVRVVAARFGTEAGMIGAAAMALGAE